MKLHIKRRINIVFGLALLILLVVGMVSYRSITQLVAASQQEGHSRDIIESLSTLLSKLQDAETGERGYIITFDDDYLQRYRFARGSIDGDVHNLEALVSDNPKQQRLLAQLKAVIDARLTELDGIVLVRKNEGLDAAVAAVREANRHSGKRLMDAARELVVSMESQEREALKQQGQRVRTNARDTALIISIGSFLGFTIIPLSVILINREITRRESVEEDLIRAIDEAERSSRFKDQFLSTMSHELRTPLNAVLGFSDLLKEERYGSLNDRQKRYVNHIHKGGEHLLKLINDILDLSKIEAGRMDITIEDVDIVEIFDEVADSLRPLAAEKGQELACSAVADLAVRVDATRFKQILTNLVGNAIKFTPEGGHILLAAAKTEDGATISVRDDGPGIPVSEQQRIFEGFYRLRGTSKSIEGTGLGLAICQRLVQLHGGRLAVESEPNQGTCFYFSLPAAFVRVQARNATQSAAGDAKSSTILVVEDDPIAADLIQSHLTNSGYQVTVCSRPELAFAMAAELQPQAMTVDILMGPVTGWDLLVKLRGDPSTSKIPVIIVTIVDQRSLGATLGADEYLIKPVERASLIAAVERCMQNRKPSSLEGQVLIVEDDPDTRELLAELISERGYHVVTAEDGKEARTRMMECVPSFVVLDLLLPKVSGFELLVEWRLDKRTADVPNIVVTSKDLSNEEESYLRAQTESLLQKQVHWKDTLLAQIQRVMSRPGEPETSSAPSAEHRHPAGRA